MAASQGGWGCVMTDQEERLLAGYAARIRETFPTVAVEEIRLLGSGDNNDALLVNGHVVFRFPRHSRAAEALAAETALLHVLAGRLPLAVPQPVYIAEGVAGYERIPGEELGRETLHGLPDADQQAVAEQLGAFLAALHAIPANALPVDVRSVRDTYGEWADLSARIERRLFPLMRPDAREEVASRLAALLGMVRASGWTPVVRHGDFGPGNVLYDPQTRRLTGVIDFGSAGLGDPALDIAGVICRAGYGEPFLARMASVYPAALHLVERARLYATTFPLQYALYGVEQDDAAALRQGLSDYV